MKNTHRDGDSYLTGTVLTPHTIHLSSLCVQLATGRSTLHHNIRDDLLVDIEIICETRGNGAGGRLLNNGRIATTSKQTTFCVCPLGLMPFACCQCLVTGTHDECACENDWMLFAHRSFASHKQANILIFLSLSAFNTYCDRHMPVSRS